MPRHPGLFISFEGVEGSGKSTQARAVTERLRDDGHTVVATREPGGPQIAELVRALLLDPNVEKMSDRTEALLYAAARAEHVDKVVAPALAAGSIVVCDRYVDSSLAYQGYARGLGAAEVLRLNAWATDDVMPDVTVLLDLDAALGIERIRQRASRAKERTLPLGWNDQAAPDRLESEHLTFHERVADGFRQLAQAGARPYVVVDATDDEDAITATILERLRPWLHRRTAKTA